MSERPETLPPLSTERFAEIKDLLRFESSISFQSHRAHESMWMLVAEVERLRAELDEAQRRIAAVEKLHRKVASTSSAEGGDSGG